MITHSPLVSMANLFDFLKKVLYYQFMITTSKKQFLTEHNKLSPSNMQATIDLLNRFKEEKRPLLKSNGWSIDKLRAPFISWLISLPLIKNKISKKQKKQTFKNYPETKL